MKRLLNVTAKFKRAAVSRVAADYARCARGRPRWRCYSRSVDVDEHHADPFSRKVGRYKPQHCAGTSSGFAARWMQRLQI